MEKITKLTTTSCYNPMFINGEKEINRIVFYKDGKEIASVKWFGSNNVFKEITLPFDVKRSVKLNLNRTDAFFISTPKERWRTNTCYDLYIHANLIGLEFKGKSQWIDTWYQNTEKDDFTVKIHGIREKWVRDNNGDKFHREYSEGDFVESFYCNVLSWDTEEGAKCRKLAEEFSELTHTNINMFDVHAMLEKFDITRK